MTNLFNKTVKPFLFGLFLIIPPILLYLFIKWDPVFYVDGDVVPIAGLVLMFLYWLSIYLVYTYRELYKDRGEQLAEFLSDKWSTEIREEERHKLKSWVVFINSIKKEYPELFD